MDTMTNSPALLSLATSVPPYRFRQDEVVAWARGFFEQRFPDFDRMAPAFANAGIETRHSCVPLDWYDQPHDWPERTRLYVEQSLALLERATIACLEQAGRTIDDVDAVVMVSSTGIATPTLDARLAQRLRMRRDLERLPIFGLGCAGGTLGLARAATLARAKPGTRVLFLVVELCGLTFRADDVSKSNVIAAALFGDGAAAALIEADADGMPARSAARPTLGPSGDYTWPDSLDIMGWEVMHNGLGVLFSRDIPSLVRDQLAGALDAFLERHALNRHALDGFIVHPGGAKVLAALEDAFALPAGGLDDARAVLRDYGNMSAATVLFVLRRALDRGARGLQLLSALGPGFTAGFQLLDMGAGRA
ncbi:MAG TPA: 3-oxoacyl-[acyl-carrier-protein] synthase III C-terminal domain-containing protein [Candidatus Sulfotelmatobacter sp.]|nr:3-oxoacyl-[acyl-carrier-protein] synthase III C-terminal domain-containing protein [Candidatus Sulfotelmatobacter sp.]